MVDIHGYEFSVLLFQISAILMIIWVLFKSSHAKYHLPPTPFALPVIGHLHLLVPNPHQAFHKLSLKYGPLFQVFLGSLPCVVACSPEIAKEFLKNYENAYLDRYQNSAVVYLTYGSKDFSFAPYGSYWKFMKKVVVSKLLNQTTLDMLLPVRNDELNRFIRSLSQKSKDGMAVDLDGELVKMTNNVISRMLMSERCSEEEEEAGDIRKLIAEIADIMGKFNLSNYIWFFKNLDVQGFGKRLKDVHTRFDALMERIMREHEEARKQKDQKTEKVKDLLNILLDIAEDESMELKLTRENIKAFILETSITKSHFQDSFVELKYLNLYISFVSGYIFCRDRQYGHNHRMGFSRTHQPSKHLEKSSGRNRSNSWKKQTFTRIRHTKPPLPSGDRQGNPKTPPHSPNDTKKINRRLSGGRLPYSGKHYSFYQRVGIGERSKPLGKPT